MFCTLVTIYYLCYQKLKTTTMNLQSGALLHNGSYRIIRTLGQGGFGITYLAEQISLGRNVCIKEFFPTDYYYRDSRSNNIVITSQANAEYMDRYKEKFLKEAKTIAKFDHPNIIHIFDVFEDNNTCYYVMEYIEGESLLQRVECNGALDELEAIKYIKDVVAALSCIHAHSINHLDVKPGNIMVRRSNNSAILIDFGLSKHYTKDGSQTSTTPVGLSHGFAPLEQYNVGGVSSFSPETDIYSLGATLYYLISGVVPPMASEIAEYGMPDFPVDVESTTCHAIECAMEVRRKDRPHRVEDFLKLIDGYTLESCNAQRGYTPALNNNIANEQTRPEASHSYNRPVTPPATPQNNQWAPRYSNESDRVTPQKQNDDSPGCLWALIKIVFKLVMWTIALALIAGGVLMLVDANGGSDTLSDVMDNIFGN